MKKLLFAAALLCAAITAHASDTSVFITVTDTDGQVWLNGTWNASLSLPSGPFGNQTPTIGGVPVPTTKKGIINAFGQIVTTLTNTSSLDQAGGQWTIQACPNSSVAQFADTGCARVTTAISGGSVDLTSRFTGVTAPRFPAGENSFGYSDIEVLPPSTPGVQYYNTGNNLLIAGLRVWDGKIWQGVGAGSGGGGAPPAGDINELNAKQDTTAFQGSGLFTNSAHTYLFTPVPQYGHYSVNSPLSAYMGGKASGSIDLYGQDAPFVATNGANTGLGQSFYKYRRMFWAGRGIFNGFDTNNNQFSGGSVAKMQADEIAWHTTAIAQDIGMNNAAGKVADTSNLYSYLWCHGGYRYAADEGCTNLKANGGNLFTRQYGMVVSGSPATGATTINSSQQFNGDDMLVGGFLINSNAAPNATCSATGYDSINHLVSVTPGCVTPALAAGTTTSTIVQPNPPTNPDGTVQSVTVHFDYGSAGAFTPGSLIVLACSNPDLEFVIPTAVSAIDGQSNQTITGLFHNGHKTGCKAAQGGTHGIGDFLADRNGTNWKTSYWMWAAPDDSHIYEATYAVGARGFINSWKHNFGDGQNRVTNAQISGNGTTTTICNLGQSDYRFGGQYVRISGATPSTFNGVYVASKLDANYCITMAGAGNGNATGATVQTGGDVNSPDGLTPGTGGLYIWNAAMIKQTGTVPSTVGGVTTISYNGQIVLWPNDISSVNGDLLVGLDDMQNKTETLTAAGDYDTVPTNSLNAWMSSNFKGEGVASTRFLGFRVFNNTPVSHYLGGTGTGLLEAPIGVQIDGPFSFDIRARAPQPRGSGIEFFPNEMITAGTGNNTYFPIRADGPGGNAGFYASYNPNLGNTVIASGTGNGIASAISMTPTTISMSGTGAFSFGGSSYIMSGLGGGAGTGCVAVNAVTGLLSRTATCGTVTSVGIAPPSWASAGSPVTGSGNVTLNLPAFIGSGATHAPGVVPDPGATAGSTRFLREDGQWIVPAGGGGGGGGTVTSFSSTNPSALFTTLVGTATTTPALSFTLSNAGPHAFFGNCSGTTGAPNYCQPQYGDIGGSAPIWNQNTTGNAATATLATTATSATTAANLSGTPALPNGTTATTQSVGDNSTKLATTAFVLANAGGAGIANIQIVLPTSAITANTCTAGATATMTGVTTTSAFSTAFATDPSAVTGWGANGGLSFIAWPTSNTINWKVCNVTASSITPGAMTINVGAK